MTVPVVVTQPVASSCFISMGCKGTKGGDDFP